jgi:hypothetical protein
VLPLSVFFLVVGYTLLWSGIKAGPNQKYARAPWQLLSDAAKNVPVTGAAIGSQALSVAPVAPVGPA